MSWSMIAGLAGRFWWAVPLALLGVHSCSLQQDLTRARTALEQRTIERNEERQAHLRTIASHEQAVAQARREDALRAAQIKARQDAATKEMVDDYEVRIADVRARAERLRNTLSADALNAGAGRKPTVPCLSDATGRTDATSGEGRLPAADALIAEEQAIQLDTLIKWVRRQTSIEINAPIGGKP